MIGLCITFFVIALVGDSFLPVIFDRQPELFIALNSRNRNLILAQPYLEWWTFFTIASVRLLVSDPLFFVIGRWYGDAGVRWVERRSPTYGPIVRTAERWFGKASYPLVLIAPNNYVCLFAGAAGMPVPAFAVLNVVGTAGRLALIWFFADLVSEPLEWVTGTISGNRLPFLVLSFGLVGLSLWLDQRSGGGEVDALLHIDEEVAEIEAEDPPPSDTP